MVSTIKNGATTTVGIAFAVAKAEQTNDIPTNVTYEYIDERKNLDVLCKESERQRQAERKRKGEKRIKQRSSAIGLRS
jgi:hypothetical protein